MSSLFKSKRSSSDSKSSSKTSNVTEPDSKTQRNTTSSKSSNALHGPSSPLSTNPGGGGGGVATIARQTSASQLRDRKASLDMQEWLETECPIDSRMMASTMTNNTLSISRSGRFKAKGKLRARLFSEDADAGPPDDHPAAPQSPRGGSSTLATPEDRQTVLDAMAQRTGPAASGRSPTARQGPAGGITSNAESGASRKSSERGTSSKLLTAFNSTDL